MVNITIYEYINKIHINLNFLQLSFLQEVYRKMRFSSGNGFSSLLTDTFSNSLSSIFN